MASANTSPPTEWRCVHRSSLGTANGGAHLDADGGGRDRKSKRLWPYLGCKPLNNPLCDGEPGSAVIALLHRGNAAVGFHADDFGGDVFRLRTAFLKSMVARELGYSTRKLNSPDLIEIVRFNLVVADFALANFVDFNMTLPTP